MQTLFYFSDVAELHSFKSFEVKAISTDHSGKASEGAVPLFWSVVGTLKEGKGDNIPGGVFPVADLPSELYAELFARICERLVTKA